MAEKKDNQLFKEGWLGTDTPIAKDSIDTMKASEVLNPNYETPKDSIDKIKPSEVLKTPKVQAQPHQEEDGSKAALAAFDAQAEDIQRQGQVTLASLMNKRKELEQKYNGGMRDQQTMIKIMAIGKLIAALGQLAGGGRGQVFVDKDPYQVNAWREIDRLRNELRYYSGKLDAQEQAQVKAMTDGLNKIAMKKTELQAQIAIQKAKDAFAKEKLKVEYEYKAALQKAKSEADMAKAEYNRDTQLKVLAAREESTIKAIGARTGAQADLAEKKHNYKLKEQQEGSNRRKDEADYKAGLDPIKAHTYTGQYSKPFYELGDGSNGNNSTTRSNPKKVKKDQEAPASF